MTEVASTAPNQLALKIVFTDMYTYRCTATRIILKKNQIVNLRYELKPNHHGDMSVGVDMTMFLERSN